MSEHRTGEAGRPVQARVTPYELAFGEAGMADRLFPRVESAVERLQVDPARRDELVMVPEVTELIRELVPPDAPPDSLEEHRAMVFHAFNFWRYGKRLYLFEPAVVRYLAESCPPLANWKFETNHSSSYLQLPANLFWASIMPDAPPEPIDGFFVTVGKGVAPTSHTQVTMLDLVMILGIRRRRAGFSVISFQTELGDGIAADWCDEPGRDGGKDFESTLPGGDMAGMYSIVTAAEALKLACRMLWYLDAYPADAVFEEAPERRIADRPDSVRLSRLDFHRVVLDSGRAADA